MKNVSTAQRGPDDPQRQIADVPENYRQRQQQP